MEDVIHVLHASGTFRASGGHIVFISLFGSVAEVSVGNLRVGAHLIIGSAQGCTRSRVLKIDRHVSISGMIAPSTLSGTVIVDSVFASNYASPFIGVSLPHASAHAVFFGFRMCGHFSIFLSERVSCRAGGWHWFVES